MQMTCYKKLCCDVGRAEPVSCPEVILAPGAAPSCGTASLPAAGAPASRPSENMARVLAAKNYDYQFVFARNSGHVDSTVMAQTLPAALEWVWAGYPVR